MYAIFKTFDIACEIFYLFSFLSKILICLQWLWNLIGVDFKKYKGFKAFHVGNGLRKCVCVCVFQFERVVALLMVNRSLTKATKQINIYKHPLISIHFIQFITFL